MNLPPSSGYVVTKPLGDKFLISALGFMDDNQPLFYKFSFLYNNEY